MYLRLAEFLSQKAWVRKSQYPQITKMKIPPPQKKIGYANHICRRSVNLTNYFLSSQICDFAICGIDNLVEVLDILVIRTSFQHD
jgi:hypothetical protein